MKSVIKSQYLAALAMLRQTIEKCPDDLWTDPTPTNQFWHVAYHVLFYTHLYLQTSEAAFTPWQKHYGNLQFLGATPWPPHTKPEIGEPFTKTDILDYLEFCVTETAVQTDKLVMGFGGLKKSQKSLKSLTKIIVKQHSQGTAIFRHARQRSNCVPPFAPSASVKSRLR